MGYFTKYDLDILGNNDEYINHEENIIKLTNENANFNYEIKWYDHQKNMKEYSKLHPKTIFKLIGEGEENGNSWIKYFLNGKMQTCEAQITYDAFDIEKLV